MDKRGGGYIAACLGTTGGGIVGAGIGQIVGLPLAAWVMTGVDFDTDTEGFEAFLEAVAAAMLMFFVAVTVFVIVVLLALWLGAVVGCGTALRLARQDGGRRTALLVGAIGPPVLVSFLGAWDWLATEGLAINDRPTYALVVGAGTLSALVARRVALLRP